MRRGTSATAVLYRPRSLRQRIQSSGNPVEKRHSGAAFFGCYRRRKWLVNPICPPPPGKWQGPGGPILPAGHDRFQPESTRILERSSDLGHATIRDSRPRPGADEVLRQKHRYLISAYVLQRSLIYDGLFYALEDRYTTIPEYDRVENADVLASEKPEILAHLRKVKAESERPRQPPR